jgi:hypothetical protein
MPLTKEQFKGTLLDVSSAWKGLENYIPSIIKDFKIQPSLALEFGVDQGFSSHVFSQLFTKVVGVDAFIGDAHINHKQGDEFYNTILNRFQNTNVDIKRADFRDFIKSEEANKNTYNLVHIDIVHLYQETFECTDWAVTKSNVVILHDTESFPEIKRVCFDVAKKHNLYFYNIPEHFGLGILSKTRI